MQKKTVDSCPSLHKMTGTSGWVGDVGQVGSRVTLYGRVVGS